MAWCLHHVGAVADGRRPRREGWCNMRVLVFTTYDRMARIEDALMNLAASLGEIQKKRLRFTNPTTWGTIDGCCDKVQRLVSEWRLSIDVMDRQMSFCSYSDALERALWALELEGWCQWHVVGLGGPVPDDMLAVMSTALMWARQFRKEYDLMLFGDYERLKANGIELIETWG